MMNDELKVVAQYSPTVVHQNNYYFIIPNSSFIIH